MSDKQLDDVGDDGECSPECLLTSEPVKDPYSTDEEKGSCRKISKRPKKRKQDIMKTNFPVNHSAKDIPVKILKKYFGLKFCPIGPGPTPEETEKLGMFKIIENLINFFTGGSSNSSNAVSAQDIVDTVLTSRRHDYINHLYSNREYAVNFKSDNYSPCLKPETAETPEDFCCKEVLSRLVKILRKPSETSSKVLFQTHSTVKDGVFRLLNVLHENVMLNGSGMEMEAGNQHGTHTETFSVQPDLTIQGYDKYGPKVPVEIYCPSHYDIEEEETNVEKKLQTNPGESTDQEEINNILDESIPRYMFGQSKLNCSSAFKQKLASQLVLQVIGSATYYTLAQGMLNVESANKAYIGLFVCDEFVQLTKVVSPNNNMVRFLPSSALKRQLFSDGSVELPAILPDINVQFSPMVLDLTVHNHRLALLFFLKYYLVKWSDVKIDFETVKSSS